MANLKSIVAVLLLALTSCGLTLPKQTLAQPEKQQDVASPLQGKVTTIEGTSVDLAGDSSMIQIVMFVSDGCAVCRHETQGLVKDLQSYGHPSNVHLYSILIGATADDARDWRDELHVDWTVATSPGDQLFRDYCSPALLTPCVIIKKPTESKITRLFGAHSVDEWEAIAGKWSRQ